MHPSHHATARPDHAAYVIAETGETVSYRELEDLSNQCAQLFRTCGLQTGDAIAILMANNARYLEICWAAQRSGLYFTCISSRLTAEEVAYIVDDCDARLLVACDTVASVAEALVDLTPRIERRFFVGGELKGYDSYEAARDRMPPERIADESKGADMLYSSGTTGRPKGIRIELSGEPIDASDPRLDNMRARYGFGEDTVYLSPAPLYHAAPLRFNLNVTAMGGTSIIMKHFDAEFALKLIEQYRVTHSQWVPTMFVRMLKLPPEIRSKYDLSSHKCAIHAAAPCPIPVKERMIEWWGPIIYEYYAGSEGNGTTAITSNEWLAHKGSVGKAVVGEIHILGDDGEELRAGEAGTIYFSGGRTFKYHKDQEKTSRAYNDKGWSTLGDVGYMDEEGYLFLTDRKANMIISGGVNIYPQETENLLITHPKVTDVAVIGVPNEEFGEEVKAVVQPSDWGSAGPELEAELIEYCRQHLSHIKCPRSVDFERELPRHATGKLYKRLLRDRYWGNHETKIV